MLDPIGIEINTKWRNFIDVAMDREEVIHFNLIDKINMNIS